MLKTRVAIAAGKVILDRTTNQFSLIEILEDIQAQAFPVVFPQLAFVWYLERAQEDNEAWAGSLAMVSNGQTLNTFQFAINFQGAIATKAMLVVGPIVITAPGRIVFTWSAAGSPTTAQYEILVTPAASAEVNPAPATRPVASGSMN